MTSKYSFLKSKAVELRKRGKTYGEIRSILGKPIPKSTLSLWCRKIRLPEWYRLKIKKLNRKNLSYALKIAHLSSLRKRELFLNSVRINASKVIRNLDKDNLKTLLAVLYLGEGAKWKGHSGLLLGSSDPNIVILYLRLLKACYHLEPGEMKCRVSYRADQDIDELQRFWSKITKIPLGNFYKTKPDPRTIGKRTLKKDYKGVCVLSCRGSSIQLELEHITNLLVEKLGPVA